MDKFKSTQSVKDLANFKSRTRIYSCNLYKKSMGHVDVRVDGAGPGCGGGAGRGQHVSAGSVTLNVCSLGGTETALVATLPEKESCSASPCTTNGDSSFFYLLLSPLVPCYVRPLISNRAHWATQICIVGHHCSWHFLLVSVHDSQTEISINSWSAVGIEKNPQFVSALYIVKDTPFDTIA